MTLTTFLARMEWADLSPKYLVLAFRYMKGVDTAEQICGCREPYMSLYALNYVVEVAQKAGIKV